MKRPRLVIVSYNANRPLSPRGERTRVLAEAFSSRWDVEVIAPEGNANGEEGGSDRRAPALRRRARELAELFLLDKHELWSRRRFRRWRPDCDAALLIGYPFSPLCEAARRLTAMGIPYVVDAGDPWVLTAVPGSARFVGGWRSARVERRLWERATGGIVTTSGQRAQLEGLFPGLALLVRPNGYSQSPGLPSRHSPANRDMLSIVHLGNLYEPRVDPAPFLESLKVSGIWRRISFVVLGSDWTGQLDRLPAGIDVERRPPLPWNEAVAVANEFDVALVLGNRNPAQLPSKAVQYLTLPIPRVALTGGRAEEALDEYVRDKPAWLIVSNDDSAAASRLAEHVASERAPSDLTAPIEEAWPAVAGRIVEFFEHCLGSAAGSVDAVRPVDLEHAIVERS